MSYSKQNDILLNKLLQYYKNNNVSYEKVASIFQIGEKTLRRWIKRFDEEQSFERKKQAC